MLVLGKNWTFFELGLLDVLLRQPFIYDTLLSVSIISSFFSYGIYNLAIKVYFRLTSGNFFLVPKDVQKGFYIRNRQMVTEAPLATTDTFSYNSKNKTKISLELNS